MAKMKEHAVFAAELRMIFEEADDSKDGAISSEEFKVMMQNKEVLDHFKNLNLEVDEFTALFSVLSADDGLADYEEFLTGALKMKGT